MDAQKNFLSVWCTAEAHLKDGVSTNLVRNARGPTKFSVLSVAVKHLPTSVPMHNSIIPAHYSAYVFLSTENFEILRRIGWYCASFDSVRGICSKLSSNVVAKKATVFASSSFGNF